jgi:hypothetical protein
VSPGAAFPVNARENMIQPHGWSAAARITIPGVEQNQKNGVSGVSANRACALTIGVLARKGSCAAPTQTSLLSKPKKTASLKSPPIGCVC